LKKKNLGERAVAYALTDGAKAIEMLVPGWIAKYNGTEM
jgi:hypothetical protein